MLRLSAVILVLSAVPLSAQFPVTWRSIGPVNTSGRIDDIAVARVLGQPDAIYIATASGGVFKSSNNGVSFQPVFDKVDAMMSIGAIAVAPSSPQTVYAGTGEANTRQSSSWGDGVYKSTDGGKTWSSVGLRDTRSIGRIVVDPTDPNIVYVSAQGHLWGPNAERGVFKTTDGGRTWNKVLFVDENTGANDIVIDPSNPQTLYAATYQRQRRGWGFNGGGPGSGIYRTTDGGAHWTKLTAGLPAGDKGRIALSLYATDPRVVYATIEARAADQGIYATTDGGNTWTKTSSLNTRPNYFSQIRIDPTDKSRVYTLGSNRGFYISNDGGHDFVELFSNVHGEDHALWIDPADGNHMVIGGDGGVSITWDRGRTWDFRRNMPIGQFYEVDVDNSVPFRVCGGLQDNGVWCTVSAVRDRNGIADRDAWNIGGGDGFHAHFDPANSNLVLQSSQNGNAAWVNIETLERQPVRPGTGDKPQLPPPPPGAGYRWNWDTPIAVSHHDPKTWFMGAQYLFKSTDRGSSWQKISPDLTLDINRDTLKMMGAVVGPDALSRHDGQTSYGSLTTIGESPLDAKVIYTGSDDGQLQLTRDGGKTWTNLTRNVPGLPEQTYVSAVQPSKFKAGRVYATFDGHYNDDYKPYVYVSDDYGATWRSIASGLPETSVMRIREYPTNAHVLVIGDARGVHFSNDDGTTWTSLSTNLPTVPVNDLMFHPRDNALVIGTHGRGIWVLDDASPLVSLTKETMASNALLPIHAARLMSTHAPQAWYGEGEHFAPNPDWDAVIPYTLHDAASGPIEITISDASGKVVRHLQGTSKQGLNRVDWNLRYDSPVDSNNVPAPSGRGGGGAGRGGRGALPAAIPQGFPRGGDAGEGGGRGGAPVGPLVMPGTYAVRVTVPGASTLVGNVVVEPDPLPKFSTTERAARHAVLMKIYDWTKTIAAARTTARALTSQRDSLKADLGAQSDSINARISRASSALDRYFNTINGLRGPIEGWSGVPTVDQQKSLGYAIDDATKSMAELNRLIETDIPAAYKSSGHSWNRTVQPLKLPRGAER